MTSIYIALGINISGTILVLRPIVNGRKVSPMSMMMCDLKALGITEAAALIGQMLISALGAFEPEVDRYPLVPPPPEVIPFPTNPPPEEPRGEMRGPRMTLGLGGDAADPALLLRAYDGEEPIGEGQQQSLKRLAVLGSRAASVTIGEIMLRQLAEMHPGVIPQAPR